MRVSDNLHTAVQDQWRLVSSPADSGNFHKGAGVQGKNWMGRKSDKDAARSVTDKKSGMSGINVGVVIRNNSANTDGIAATCFCKRDIVCFMRCGEGTQWSLRRFGQLCRGHAASQSQAADCSDRAQKPHSGSSPSEAIRRKAHKPRRPQDGRWSAAICFRVTNLLSAVYHIKLSGKHLQAPG